MSVLKKQHGSRTVRHRSEASVTVKGRRRLLPFLELVMSLCVAAVVAFAPCLASQGDVDVRMNEVPTGLFTDAEVAEIEAVMPLPEAMALIYMGRMSRNT